MKTYVFPDTQFYLHWPLFTETDWHGLYGPGEVVILVPPVVLYELDKNKTKNRLNGVKKRSARTLNKLEELGAEQDGGALIASGIFVQVLFDDLPVEAYANEFLSKEVADDRILAYVIRFKEEHPQDRVAIQTGDNTLKMKARRHVEVVASPDTRISDEEEESAIDAANRKVQALTSRQPVLRIQFASGGNRLLWSEHAVLLAEDGFVKNRMDAIRDGNAKQKVEGMSAFSTLPGESREEAIIYNRKLDKYCLEVEKYLHDAYRADLRCYRMPRVSLTLSNDGTGPGNAVTVILRLDGDLRFWNDGSYPPDPKPPRTPDRPMAWLAGGRHEDEFEWPNPPKLKEPIFKLSDGAKTASIEVATVVNGAPRSLPVLRVDSIQGFDAQNFCINCTISCAEMLEPIASQLHVVDAGGEDQSYWPAFDEYLRERYETKKEGWKRTMPHLFEDDD